MFTTPLNSADDIGPPRSKHGFDSTDRLFRAATDFGHQPPPKPPARCYCVWLCVCPKLPCGACARTLRVRVSKAVVGRDSSDVSRALEVRPVNPSLTRHTHPDISVCWPRLQTRAYPALGDEARNSPRGPASLDPTLNRDALCGRPHARLAA